MAPIPATWLRKNAFHVWPDPGRRLAILLGDRRLRDLDPELEQLAMDARCAPQWILHTHTPDQTVDLDRNLGPAATGA